MKGHLCLITEELPLSKFIHEKITCMKEVVGKIILVCSEGDKSLKNVQRIE